jgi:hypothetical protein
MTTWRRRSFLRFLHPAGLVAAPLWGAWLGYFHEDAFLWLAMGPVLGTISVWIDRKLILQQSPWRDPNLPPLPITPSEHWAPEVIGSFLAVYLCATLLASALVVGTYWLVRLNHPISN